MLVFNENATRLQLNLLWDQLQASSEVHLFQNDFEPTPEDTYSNFTEADGSSYVRIALTSTWSMARKLTSGVFVIEATPVSWFPPVAVDWSFFGYLIVSSGQLICSERFPEEITMTPIGQPFVLTPRVYFGNLAEVCDLVQ